MIIEFIKRYKARLGVVKPLHYMDMNKVCDDILKYAKKYNKNHISELDKLEKENEKLKESRDRLLYRVNRLEDLTYDFAIKGSDGSEIVKYVNEKLKDM